MLRVGRGRVDITPTLGLPMVGMPGTPRGEGVQWQLRSRVFLVDDEERRLAPEAGDRMSDAARELLRSLSSAGHGSHRWTMASTPDSV
jgi:hypothetical protein